MILNLTRDVNLTESPAKTKGNTIEVVQQLGNTTVARSSIVQQPSVTLMAITPNAETLIESAGRVCWDSANKKTEESAGTFIKKLIAMGHESVLEHAHATFLIQGGSRAFTHQAVRSRLCSFSQRSQRYVNEKEFRVILPPKIAENPEAAGIFFDTIEQIQEAYTKLKDLGIPNEDARFLLPNATESEIVIGANFRQWRHVLKLRISKKAQWEIRGIANNILKILVKEVPNVFGDLIP